MNSDGLATEFRDELQQRADTLFGGRLHQAFLDWYVEAEFGNCQWHFTDDAKDGGVDAVVWNPGHSPAVFLLQSKFKERLGGAPLHTRAYQDFRRVISAFRHGDEAFEGFLDSVREDLRRLYRKAFDHLASENWHQAKKAFRLVTTCRPRRGACLDDVPRQNMVFAPDIMRLYEQFWRNGWTPKARPLELTVYDKLSYQDRDRKVTSYLINARVDDFRKYLEKNEVARVVARNIRYNLAGRVGRAIRRTYEKKAHDFWYLHNGLTIICDEYTEQDQVATLLNPSVVNGAQSLYAIASSPNRASRALVITRIVVRGARNGRAEEDDEWLQTVIRGVNTQNRVRASDFRSNQPEQIELQKRFREQRVFYERKRGEWREVKNQPHYRGFERLSLQRLGQILSAVSDRDGHGVLLVKRGIDELFEEKTYPKLFPSRSKIAHRFKRIYVAYRVYRLLHRFGYKDARIFRKHRHGFWNTLWILHNAMGLDARPPGRLPLQAIRERFDELEARGALGRRAQKVARLTTAAVWRAWRQARRADPERWTANNFFKSKFGNRAILRIGFPKVRTELRLLGKHILA